MHVAGVVLAALALTSTFAEAAVPGRGAGLRGFVMRGPTKPVCHENEPCEEPAGGLVEAAALSTARALEEVSSHWDSVYRAMRRAE